jgi:hypothetical protein
LVALDIGAVGAQLHLDAAGDLLQLLARSAGVMSCSALVCASPLASVTFSDADGAPGAAAGSEWGFGRGSPPNQGRQQQHHEE